MQQIIHTCVARDLMKVMLVRRVVAFILFLFSETEIGIAGECQGNLNALGTSRIIVVDPGEHPRVGTLQYQETLPLNEHEIVSTFDDGPLPPYTSRAEPVKDRHDLARKIAAIAPGSLMQLGLFRHGEEKNIAVTVGRLPWSTVEPKRKEKKAPTDGTILGLTLAPARAIAGASDQGESGREGRPGNRRCYHFGASSRKSLWARRHSHHGNRLSARARYRCGPI